MPILLTQDHLYFFSCNARHYKTHVRHECVEPLLREGAVTGDIFPLDGEIVGLDQAVFTLAHKVVHLKKKHV